ncbi:MAG: DUF1566 domain-containing protein, partial [Desulfobacterales bacterium]|nr:DUF1566 domain-containing protein [Desulfobacterales bacterium]
GDGAVTDRATGLMWQQSGLEEEKIHKEAFKYIETLNREKFAGYDGWRLPTIEELASLMEPEVMNGELHNNPIFNKIQCCLWSVDEGSSGEAWAAFFYDGYALRYYITFGLYVRGVRSINR